MTKQFCASFFFIFLISASVLVRGASIRKSTHLHYTENLAAEADTLIYKPKTYKYYQVHNRHYYNTLQQQPPYYYQQPVYYQQPTYYYPSYSYPGYSSPGGFGFNFCLACFGFGFGKK